MKKKRKIEEQPVLNDAAHPYVAPVAMVRTQIYLTRAEYDFLQREADRIAQPMASIIRGFIDEKMETPSAAWSENPMLRETVSDPAWAGHEDGAVNHDHYVYSAPKRKVRRGKSWEDAPAPADDFGYSAAKSSGAR